MAMGKTAAENGDGPPSRARRPSVGSGRTEYPRIFDILQSELQDIFLWFFVSNTHKVEQSKIIDVK